VPIEKENDLASANALKEAWQSEKVLPTFFDRLCSIVSVFNCRAY
jgi:hypothetical protein